MFLLLPGLLNREYLGIHATNTRALELNVLVEFLLVYLHRNYPRHFQYKHEYY